MQGLRVYNDSGILTISDTFKNYVLHARGSTATGTDGRVTVGFPPLGSFSGILYIKPSSTDFYVGGYTALQVDSTFYIESYNLSGARVGNKAFEWAIFKNDSTEESTHGITVYTETGEIGYTSGSSPLKIHHTANCSLFSPSAVVHKDIPLPSGTGIPWIQMLSSPYNYSITTEGGGFAYFSGVWSYAIRVVGADLVRVSSIRDNAGFYNPFTSLATDPANIRSFIQEFGIV